MFWNVPSLIEVVKSIKICGRITQHNPKNLLILNTHTINKILPILSPLLPDSDGLLQPLSHAHLDVKTIVYEETDYKNRNKKLNQINQPVYVTERNSLVGCWLPRLRKKIKTLT